MTTLGWHTVTLWSGGGRTWICSICPFPWWKYTPMANLTLPMWWHWASSWEETLRIRARPSTHHPSTSGHWAIRDALQPYLWSWQTSESTWVFPTCSCLTGFQYQVWIRISAPIISGTVYPTLSSLLSGRGFPWLLLSPLNSLPSFWSSPILICTTHLEFHLLMGFLDGFVYVNCLEPPDNFSKNKD